MEPGQRLYEALLSVHTHPSQLKPWSELTDGARANLAADEERRIHTSRSVDELAQLGYARHRELRAAGTNAAMWQCPPWAELAGDAGATVRQLWRAGARAIRAEVQSGATGAHDATEALVDHMLGGKVEEALLAPPSASEVAPWVEPPGGGIAAVPASMFVVG